jgi:hypothetical protein
MLQLIAERKIVSLHVKENTFIFFNNKELGFIISNVGQVNNKY